MPQQIEHFSTILADLILLSKPDYDLTLIMIIT